MVHILGISIHGYDGPYNAGHIMYKIYFFGLLARRTFLL